MEEDLCGVGRILSKRFEDRIKDRIQRLSKFKDVEITHLIMGMGGWVLKGKLPTVEHFQGKADYYTIELDDRADGIVQIGNSVWDDGLEEINPGILEVLKELTELFETITHNQYLCIFDIDCVQMKELLK